MLTVALATQNSPEAQTPLVLKLPAHRSETILPSCAVSLLRGHFSEVRGRGQVTTIEEVSSVVQAISGTQLSMLKFGQNDGQDDNGPGNPVLGFLEYSCNILRDSPLTGDV